MSYVVDREWAGRFLNQIVGILRAHAGVLLSVRVADPSEDMMQAVDLVVTVAGGDVAVRIRRDACAYRDLTIRAIRASGAITEIQKIRAGFARWYFYGWTQDDTIIEWILVDLDLLRATDLLDQAQSICNQDGTGFVVVPRLILREHGCIVAEKCLDRPFVQARLF